MKVSAYLPRLAWLIAALALVAAAAGLFWPGGSGPYPFTTLRGQTAMIAGQGLYRYDTVFIAAGNRGTDAVTLALGIPLLLLAAAGYGRGSLRGGLLLMGGLAYFLYVYASLALNAAYNPLFLVYVALFSASLYGLVLAFTSAGPAALPDAVLARLPRRGPGYFLIASGLVTIAVWLVPLAGALARGEPPALLTSYTTMVTDVLDLGVITPGTLIAGALILRRAALGYLIACALLFVEAMLFPMIVAQTIIQLGAGVTISAGEAIGPVAGFAALGLGATWCLVALLRPLAGPPLTTHPSAA